MKRRVIVFFHGIVGHPRFFRDFVRLIPPEDDVHLLLLAGHGGKVDDFSRASMGQWLEQVDHMLDRAEERYEEIILVGHSMGTLFCLQQMRKRGKVRGLFLLAPPLRIRVRVRRQLEKICAVLSAGDKISEELFDGALGVDPDPRFWKYIGWIPNYLALLREICKTRRLAREMEAPDFPCRIFLSAEDELVSIKSADDLAVFGSDVHVLENSTHFTYSTEDYRILMESFTELLEEA